jgi:hypothetical protein
MKTGTELKKYHIYRMQGLLTILTTLREEASHPRLFFFKIISSDDTVVSQLISGH